MGDRNQSLLNNRQGRDSVHERIEQQQQQKKQEILNNALKTNIQNPNHTQTTNKSAPGDVKG